MSGNGNLSNMSSAYVEYAKAHGRTPDEMVEYDRARGVHFTAYIAWRQNPNRESWCSDCSQLVAVNDQCINGNCSRAPYPTLLPSGNET